MTISPRISRHLKAKRDELDALLDAALAAADWHEEVIPKAIELQKEITAAESLLTAVFKKEATQ